MAQRIGEVCAATGLTRKQVRDWERHGLVRSVRGSGQQRLYDAAAIERLRRAKRMREAGLSLAEVRSALALTDGSEFGADVRAVDHIRRVLAGARKHIDIADEFADALRQRLVRARRT